ncbi:MAG: hypothetical protein DRH26_03615 [Deltaproteobacteria bacterium]|nr:MAG: hypothetical protein DRH26_03615 [Deltaproteobacteria bacterium]
MKYFIGIDNGVTGSICILDENGNCLEYFPTPVQKTLNYTKAKEYVNRVTVRALAEMLTPYAKTATVILERPMVNPLRWKASISAIRCDEATRGVLEALGTKLIYVDSREWQTPMLPKRKAVARLPKGSTAEEKKINKAAKAAFKTETKSLSLMVANRLFPTIDFKKDGDAALIAEWARRNNL